MSLTVDQALEIIRHNKRVAIVGLSPKTDRPSNRVSRFLLEKGFDIVPVNPAQKEILDQPCVSSLADLNPEDVGWVDFLLVRIDFRILLMISSASLRRWSGVRLVW